LLLKKEGKILVVDDEPSITDSLRLLLGLEGYKVEIASSYTAARAAVERCTFDLVLTDLQLPAGWNSPANISTNSARPIAPNCRRTQ
jgi:DNA-binding response OmpR family regulator